jgi:hypothetical protein
MAFSMASLKAWIRGINPAITRLVAAALGIALFAWSGMQASRARAATQAEVRRADSVLAMFAEWRRRYRPAVAAESIAWRRTWLDLQGLGVSGDERLALTRAVTRAAEAAGLRDVRVLIGLPDTTGSAERLSTEGVLRQSAPFSLSVEGRGNLQALVNFLGELPPSVAPTQLILLRQDGRARHRLVLAVYETEFPNGPTTLRTPLERSAPGARASGRTGG